MMMVFRMMLVAALVSSSVVLSMESEHKEITIQNVLDALIKPYPQRKLDDIALITLYLHCGGNINAKGTVAVGADGQKISGMNVLMTSVCYDRTKLMKFVINQCYARLDCVNEYGDTALHIAAKRCCASVVRVLLASGAKTDIRNNNGRTALEEAYNFPWQQHPFHANKRCYAKNKYCINYHFPTMIKLLERFDKGVRHYNQNSYTRNNNFQLRNNQMNNTRNRPQLRIQQ